MANQTVNHFLLVPLMSQSHLIPFADMAKVLAHHGQQVTMLMTPINADRYKSVIDYALKFDLKINFLTLPFPCQETGLPLGCENLDTLPSLDLSTKFFQASSMLQEPVEKWIQETESPPTCVVADICLPWTTDLGLKFQIPRTVFHTVSCFAICCNHNNRFYTLGEKVGSGFEAVNLPGLPDTIEFDKAKALLSESEKKKTEDTLKTYTLFKEAERSADGLLLNTFEEMEFDYVNAYKKFVKNVWCIGPLSLINNKNIPTVHEHECFNWLDSKKPGSVIYVCFGSLFRLSPPQLIELGLALESSNSPFIWVNKKGDCTPEMEEWLKRERFEEKIKGRGLIIKGWAPQVQILSHGAIGGFLTHCGWNSTLESISAGVPMITWPMFAEQIYNQRLIVDVLKVGVKVGLEIAYKDMKELVKKEDIKKAIVKLVDGKEIRNRAKELGEKARRAIEKGGSSYRNVTSLINHVNQHLAKKKTHVNQQITKKEEKKATK